MPTPTHRLASNEIRSTCTPDVVSLATPLSQAEGYGVYAYDNSFQYCCVLLMGHKHSIVPPDS
jgi:hypothetical protein